jgi:acetyltransferase-like isoleucine patch superfamily enzyme
VLAIVAPILGRARGYDGSAPAGGSTSTRRVDVLGWRRPLHPPDRRPPIRSTVLGLLLGPFRASLVRTLRATLRHRTPVVVGGRFRIVGASRLHVRRGARVFLGAGFYGFLHGRERSILRVRGRLELLGNVAIASGNRWDVGPDAVVTVGDRTYVSPDCTVVASHGITIGERCAIGWGVQLLDDDFHRHGRGGVVPDGPTTAPVTIGDHVWIGSRATIYKGVTIADGCIVAGGAVVTRSVEEPRSMVAGSPARVVRNDVDWT